MQSKMVLNRARAAVAVEVAVAAHGESVAGILTAHQTQAEEESGSSGIDYHKLIEELTSSLTTAREAMIAADAHHQRLQARLIESREQLKSRKRGLLRIFLQIRHTVRSLYGLGGDLTLTGVSGPSPADPVTLLAQARQTMDLLVAPEVEAEALGLGGVRLDFAAMARDLEPAVTALQGAVDEFALVVGLRDATLMTKNEAIVDFDRTQARVIPLLADLFRLAGVEELAARIRTTVSGRRRRRPKPEDPTEALATQKALEPPAAATTASSVPGFAIPPSSAAGDDALPEVIC